MSGSTPDSYITLMASLPPLGPLFAQTQPPISRIRLEQRLSMLAEPDRLLLARLEAVLHWPRVSAMASDLAVAEAAKSLLAALPSAVADVVQRRLEIRMLVAALRLRARGEEPPEDPSVWRLGRWGQTILSHWSDSDFRLGRVHPWLETAQGHFAAGDALSLERLLLIEAWKSLGALSGHYFDFPAVAAYVMRWNIVERWYRYDGKRADAAFADLITVGMAQHGQLFVARKAA